MTDEAMAKLNAVMREVCEGFKAPEGLTVSEWADRYVVLSTDDSAEAGRWKTSRTPYLKEVADSFTDDRVDQTVLVAGAQMGKTALQRNMLGYAIDQDPGPIMYGQPTKDLVEDFSKRRLAPFIRDNPRIRDKLGESKSRDTNNTIRRKSFPGGMLTMVGSNAPGDLASVPARYVFGDEIDRWAASAGGEGDPVKLLTARTSNFYNRKIVLVSTPTTKGASRIEKAYALGTQEEWVTECPHCKEWSQIRFANLSFNHEYIGDNGMETVLVSDINWCCPNCGCLIPEDDARRLPQKWEAKNPKAIETGVRSFWITGFYSPWKTWESVIRDFLTANRRKDIELMKVAVNTGFGELWEDKESEENAEGLLSRLEDYGAEVPDNAYVLTMGMDTQDDRMEYEIVGHGFMGESWGIEYGKIFGKPSSPEVWEKIDELLERRFLKKNGRALKISLAFIDMQGHYNQDVREQCGLRRFNRCFAIRGSNQDSDPYTDSPKQMSFKNPVTKKRGTIWYYNIGVSAGKEHIMAALAVEEPGPSYYHFPKDPKRGYDRTYFLGLLAERFEISPQGKPVWKKVYDRNEPLDCRNYANAAFEVLNISDRDMLQIMEKESSINNKKKKDQTPKKRPRMRSIENVYGKEL